MARPTSEDLTAAESRIMRSLWRLGRGSVREVLEGLDEGPLPAYTTVLTMLTVLERKGFVRRVQSGRKNMYQPAISCDQARHMALQTVAKRLFGGSMQQLALFAGGGAHVLPQFTANGQIAPQEDDSPDAGGGGEEDSDGQVAVELL